MSPSVALVAGGSRGLVLLIARELLDRDLTVVVCARRREEVDPGGGRVFSYACDVADARSVEDMVRWIEAEAGPPSRWPSTSPGSSW